MTHPFEKHKESSHSREAAKKRVGGYKSGGAVEEKVAYTGKGSHVEKEAKEHKRGGKVSDGKALVKKVTKDIEAHEKAEHKASGGPVKARLDRRARGGKTKHHTKINILVAPHGGDASSPGPAGAGAAPPPIPPKMPMVPPGPMGAGPPPMPAGGPPRPGGPGIPGMMKRGGKVMSGIPNKENLKDWAGYASKNTRYADGGGVHPGVGVGAGGATGIGRLRKAKKFGSHKQGMTTTKLAPIKEG